MEVFETKLIAAPEGLQAEVECFRIMKYSGSEPLAIKISPIAVPGIVVQHQGGRSAIDSLVVGARVNTALPTAFIYGPGTWPSVMNYKAGPYTTTQAILKPHALRTLFGINAATLTDNLMGLDAFANEDLEVGLLTETNDEKRVGLLVEFMAARQRRDGIRDELVEASLDVIHQSGGAVTIRELIEQLHLSERQFEKRFNQTVGISPQAYIRVKRFNEALRLMKTGQYERLIDVAHALNYYDQSHFIRDLKRYSGITPRGLSQLVSNFSEQGGFSYV